ncbi:MAG: response regulator [Pirellulaceae bacterium]|nr:response regulator [Pirellulaceae bacterium]
MQFNEPQILIADDDEALRAALAEVFQRRGYRTTLVGDGREALEVVHSRITLHLAILDVHMPRLSGLETLEEIRRLQVPNLPCILMTAEINEAIAQQALALADSPVLEKPFALRTITETVRDVMQRRHGFAL